MSQHIKQGSSHYLLTPSHLIRKHKINVAENRYAPFVDTEGNIIQKLIFAPEIDTEACQPTFTEPTQRVIAIMEGYPKRSLANVFVLFKKTYTKRNAKKLLDRSLEELKQYFIIIGGDVTRVKQS